MKIFSRAMIERLGWTTASYGAIQVFRLINNLILARLLAPELFGIMLIVNTLRTGVELLSDIGIGQNIISNKDGEDPDFYNTAWTLQIMRGVVLFLIGIAASYPVSLFYDNDVLLKIMPVISLIFLSTGVQSVSIFLLQKRLRLKRLAIFEASVNACSTIVHVLLALYTPTIWALVFGGIISSILPAIATFFLVPDMRYRLQLSPRYSKAILHFGKWIFLSSLVFFLAMNFDRLYLAQAVPLALLGVYGVARSLADMLSLFVARIGNVVIFPMVAAAGHSSDVLREKIARSRLLIVGGAAALVSLFVSVADLVVFILYDERYHAAAYMLPIIAVGVWFSILCTLSESVLLGIGRPIYGAFANASKLVWLVVGLPLATTAYGIAGAVCVMAAVDLIRYVPLLYAQKAERLSFIRQDLLMTVAMFGMIVVWRTLFAAIGLTDGLGELHGLTQLLQL